MEIRLQHISVVVGSPILDPHTSMHEERNRERRGGIDELGDPSLVLDCPHLILKKDVFILHMHISGPHSYHPKKPVSYKNVGSFVEK